MGTVCYECLDSKKLSFDKITCKDFCDKNECYTSKNICFKNEVEFCEFCPNGNNQCELCGNDKIQY